MSVPMQSMSDILKAQTPDEEERRRIDRMRAMGLLGLGMGLRPTMAIGEALTGTADREEKLGADARQTAAEQLIRAGERQQAQANWQQQYAATLTNRADLNADRDEARASSKAAREEAAAARQAAADERAAAAQFRQTTTLRTELNQRVQAMQSSTSQAQTLLSLANSPDILSNPQAQTAIVFAFGKMLDPTSTVREGEYKLFEESRGLLDSWGMTPERIQNGARLTPQQIKQMVSVANTVNSGVKERRAAIDAYYRDLAKRNKLDPDDLGLISPPSQVGGAPPPADIGAPPPGAVRRKR